MAGEGDVNDEVLVEDKTEPTFWYVDLTFQNPTEKATYEKFQKLVVIFKRNHTNWAKKGLGVLTNQAEQPNNDGLL